MRRYVLFIIVVLLTVVSLQAVNVVPHPYEYDINPYYSYVYNEYSGIVVKHKSLKDVAVWLKNEMAGRIDVSIDIVRVSHNPIYLRINKYYEAEEYNINAGPYGITVSGGSAAGVFYGLQTLLQFVAESDNGSVIVPAMVVSDAPQYVLRGWFIDMSDMDCPFEKVKSVIDTLAFYKFNKLYLSNCTENNISSITDYAKSRYMDVVTDSCVLFDSCDSDLQNIYYMTGDKNLGFIFCQYPLSDSLNIVPVISEILWTNPDIKDWGDFKTRLRQRIVPEDSSSVIKYRKVY